jgi:hypothetical protein
MPTKEQNGITDLSASGAQLTKSLEAYFDIILLAIETHVLE